MNVAFFLARRLYAGRNRRRISTPAVLIATAGIAIGLATMIVSVCVVLGFQRNVKAKVTGLGSDIEVLNVQSLSSTDSYPMTVTPQLQRVVASVPNVQAVQRFATKMGMMKTDSDFSGILLKGVGPEYDLSFLRSSLIAGQMPTFSDRESHNRIVISKNMADKLHLQVGSAVYCYFFDRSMRTRRFTVSGIYQTNMEQFDNSIVMTDLHTVQRLYGWSDAQCGGFEIKTHNYDLLAPTTQALSAVLKQQSVGDEAYVALSIEELYPQIFEWLGLLDMNVWIILVLMACVGGFTMVSGLLILILENTATIGLLKSLGATNTGIRNMFLYLAVFLIGRGLLVGNVIGIGICLLQQHFQIFKLDAQTYYVDSVPIYINVWLVIALNVATLLVTLLALVGPSFLVSRIQPAKAIRYE